MKMEKTKATSTNRSNGQEKSATSQSPELFDGIAMRMYTIKRLLQRRNALARYVGRPCVLSPDRIRPYPAILHEYGMRSKGFGGYRIQLAPFNGIFKQVKFRGKGNGNDVVSGYIIDKQGGIESFALSPDTPDGYTTLSLTPNSLALYASVPMEGKRAVWDNITVELHTGVADERIERVIKNMSLRLLKLECEVGILRQMLRERNNSPI